MRARHLLNPLPNYLRPFLDGVGTASDAYPPRETKTRVDTKTKETKLRNSLLFYNE